MQCSARPPQALSHFWVKPQLLWKKLKENRLQNLKCRPVLLEGKNTLIRILVWSLVEVWQHYGLFGLLYVFHKKSALFYLFIYRVVSLGGWAEQLKQQFITSYNTEKSEWLSFRRPHRQRLGLQISFKIHLIENSHYAVILRSNTRQSWGVAVEIGTTYFLSESKSIII